MTMILQQKQSEHRIPAIGEGWRNNSEIAPCYSLVTIVGITRDQETGSMGVAWIQSDRPDDSAIPTIDTASLDWFTQSVDIRTRWERMEQNPPRMEQRFVFERSAASHNDGTCPFINRGKFTREPIIVDQSNKSG